MANEEQQQLVKMPKKVVRELPVKLTDGEVAQLARDIGRLNMDRQSMEAQAKQVSSHWKDRIAGIEAKIADLATKAHEGTENRPVDCEEVHDYRRGEVKVLRKDTQEQLEVRPMTADERQPNLPAPGMEKPPKPKKGEKAPKAADEQHADAGAANDADTPPPEGEGVITEPQVVLDAETKKSE